MFIYIFICLQNYFKYNILQDEGEMSDDCNFGNSTLRRKLFFNKEEEFISPVKYELDFYLFIG